MDKNLYIDASSPDEVRVVLKSEKQIEEYEYENKNKLNLKGNIYLGIVSRVEPSLQAAFINYGRIKHGFLAFNDIQSDYYQIPSEDKEKLQETEKKIREDLKNNNQDDFSNTKDDSNDENPQVQENLSENSENNSEQIKDNSSKEISNIEDKKDIREELKKSYGLKKYRIQEVIKPGQIILVQVLKEERGQKGSALTTFISLAGKYIVLMPNTAKGGGISRKIFNFNDRNNIKKILNEIDIPSSMGMIVRTAGANKSKNEIQNDLENLINSWKDITNKTLSSNAPSIIYEESVIIKRSIRDIYDSESKYIYVDGNDGYQKTKQFVKELIPKCSKFVKKHRGKSPLFLEKGIEQELLSIFESRVKLKSGGYLIINPTEALVAIDINSGQSIKQTNIEKTALNTNIEAAEEIARQIKLRDLSGLVVIDFIDMLNFHNRKVVERKLKESLRKDRARIQVGRISNFGLLEMTRQRLREGSIQWETVLSTDSFSLKILKKIQILSLENKVSLISADIPLKVKQKLESEYIKQINFIEKKNKIKIILKSELGLGIPEYSIGLHDKKNKRIKVNENILTEYSKNKDLTYLKNNKKKFESVSKQNKPKKTKKKSIIRTLWKRRKKTK